MKARRLCDASMHHLAIGTEDRARHDSPRLEAVKSVTSGGCLASILNSFNGNR